MAEKKKGSTTEIVRALAEPLARAWAHNLGRYVQRKEGADWYLRSFIDKEGGVGIDDCVDLTRAINPVLGQRRPHSAGIYLGGLLARHQPQAHPPGAL